MHPYPSRSAFLALLAGVALGAAVGFSARPKPKAPPSLDFGGETHLVATTRVSDAAGEYQPFYVVIDGHGRHVDGRPFEDKDDVWIIQLANGRVRVHAVRVDAGKGR